MDLKIYPNPGKDVVHIEYPAHLKGLTLTVVNIAGQVVKTATLSDGQQDIKVNDLESGFYFLSIQSQVVNLTRKLVKQR